MFKKDIEKKAVEIYDPLIKHIYSIHMNKLGYEFQEHYNGKIKRFPLIFIPLEDSKKILVKTKEEFIKEKNLEHVLEIVPFYKLIEKSFVKDIIAEKNDRNIFQYESKHLFKKLKNRKGSNLIESAIDKNAYLLTCLNYTIGFLYGYDNKSYLCTQRRAFIIKSLKIMKKSL